LVIALAPDLKLIVVMNNGDGKMRGAATPTGELRMSVVVKRIGVKQIWSDSARRSDVGPRSAVDLTKTVAVKLPVSPRGWLVSGPWKISGARRKSCTHVIVGRIDLRCCLVPRLIWRT
jgi:hypothetical protein